MKGPTVGVRRIQGYGDADEEQTIGDSVGKQKGREEGFGHLPGQKRTLDGGKFGNYLPGIHLSRVSSSRGVVSFPLCSLQI